MSVGPGANSFKKYFFYKENKYEDTYIHAQKLVSWSWLTTHIDDFMNIID